MHGSLNINDHIQNDFYGDIILTSKKEDKIDVRSDLNSDLIISSENGKYLLASELNSNGDIYLISGNLITNDYHISADEFITDGNENRTLNSETQK